MKKASILVLFFAMLFLAINPTLVFSQTKQGGTLVVGVESDLKSLDWHGPGGIVTTNTATLIHEGLLIPDDKNEGKPALAESWDISADGKEYTFYLQKGVKFHNGRKFTSEDVKWNYERMINMKKAPLGSQFRAMVDLVTTPDPYTVKFVLKEPSAGFLGLFFDRYANMFVIIAKESVNADNNIVKPIGTGPFEFVEWKRNEHIHLKAFKDYRQAGLPRVDEVILKVIIDQTTRLNALRAGDADIVRLLPIEAVAEAQNKPPKGYKVVRDVGQTIPIVFHCNKPPFNDVRVRQAVAYAIDREELNLGIAFGTGYPTNQQYAPGLPWYFEDVPGFKRDIKKAKSLLKEAGYPKGVDVTFLSAASYKERVETGKILQHQLAEIGINVKLEILDVSTVLDKVFKGEFQMCAFAFGQFSDPDSLISRAFVRGGVYWLATTGEWVNQDMFDLAQAGRKELDPLKRRAIYKTYVSRFVEEAPWIWLFNYPFSFGYRDHVKGYVPKANDLSYYKGGLPYAWIDK